MLGFLGVNALAVMAVLGVLSPYAVGVSKLSAAGLRQAVYKRWDGAVYRVPVAQKEVALTFDDGPSPQFTPQILQILDAYGVKATFFVVGNQAKLYPGLIREIAERGHAIGNHTFTHPSDIRELTEAQFLAELVLTSRVVEQSAGIRPRLFRPPKGRFGSRELRLAESLGYQVVLWSVSADHHEATTPQRMAARVIRMVRPGVIILMHDGPLPIRWRDVAALPLIIEELLELGYRFVTVPELLLEGFSEHRSGFAVHMDRTPEQTGKSEVNSRAVVGKSGFSSEVERRNQEKPLPLPQKNSERFRGR